MSVADNRISAVHQTGRNMLRTRARLAGWVEARQRGVTSATSDAITDAALAGVIELLEMWEADSSGEPAEQPEPAREEADRDRPWPICYAEHRGMLCDRQRGHQGDHVDIYGPLPDHTWAEQPAAEPVREAEALGVTDEQRLTRVEPRAEVGSNATELKPARRRAADPGELMEEPDLYPTEENDR